MAKNSRMSNFVSFLRDQIHRSAATNSKMFSDVYSAMQSKDILAAGAAIAGEISATVKDIGKEISSINNELASEFSGSKSDARLPLDAQIGQARNAAPSQKVVSVAQKDNLER